MYGETEQALAVLSTQENFLHKKIFKEPKL